MSREIEDWLFQGDFEKWISKTKNLKELSEEICTNWALVKRFLTWFLAEHGFFILSKREIENLKKERGKNGRTPEQD